MYGSLVIIEYFSAMIMSVRDIVEFAMKLPYKQVVFSIRLN